MLSAKNPLWFYEFADRNAPADIAFPKGFQAGAWHADDVQYLFRTEKDVMTKEQVELSDTMIRYWSTFAHNGEPSAAGLPEWPKFTTPDTVLSLAPKAMHTVDYAQEHRLAFWKQVGV